MLSEEENLIHKFHRFHGKNVYVSEDRTIARRVGRSRNMIVFSEKAIRPGEIFVINIDRCFRRLRRIGLFNQLRVGFTQLTPDMCEKGVSKSIRSQEDFCDEQDIRVFNRWGHWKLRTRKRTKNLEISDKYITTCKGLYSRSIFTNEFWAAQPTIADIANLNPGFRIGMFYSFQADKAHIFYVINDRIFGPYISKVKVKEPFHFFANLSGLVQQIRIVQVLPVSPPTLQNLCCSVIHETHDLRKLKSILPKMILNLTLFRSRIKSKKYFAMISPFNRLYFIVSYDYIDKFVSCSFYS